MACLSIFQVKAACTASYPKAATVDLGGERREITELQVSKHETTSWAAGLSMLMQTTKTVV